MPIFKRHDTSTLMRIFESQLINNKNKLKLLESRLTIDENKIKLLESRLTINENKIKILERNSAEADQTYTIEKCGGEYNADNYNYRFKQNNDRLELTINVKGNDGGNIKYKETGYSIQASFYDANGNSIYNKSFTFEDPPHEFNYPPPYTSDTKANATVILSFDLNCKGFKDNNIYGQFSIPMLYKSKDNKNKKYVYIVDTNNVPYCTGTNCCPLLSIHPPY